MNFHGPPFALFQVHFLVLLRVGTLTPLFPYMYHGWTTAVATECV